MASPATNKEAAILGWLLVSSLLARRNLFGPRGEVGLPEGPVGADVAGGVEELGEVLVEEAAPHGGGLLRLPLTGA
jgi:hypothetical protein